jgi:diguanylate cyclase (GGDEF)-like protein
MVVPARSTVAGRATPLESVLELGRSAAEDNLSVVLTKVAETIHTVSGFNAVVINIYRPAWDDYEVVYLVGNEDSHAALDGTSAPRETWDRLFATEQQRLPGVFFLTGEAAFWEGLEDVYTPDIPPSNDPDAWQPDDGLLVFLRDAGGAPLGFVSMDEPVSGRRPNDDELRQIRAICSHAEQALSSARRNARAAESERILSHLLAASVAITTGSKEATPRELLEIACDTIVPHLGFERVAIYGLPEGDALRLGPTRGWQSAGPGPSPLPPELSAGRVQDLMRPEREHAGCWLIPARDLFGVSGPGCERSCRNGRGLAAWGDHVLLVPGKGDNGELRGVTVIEDPIDRLLPTTERSQAIRLLIDQLSAVLNGIAHRQELSILASHDPLTGVRNRRGLTDLLSSHPGAALVVCDLDHFKQINDRYGHDVGDRVLARFGELLRSLSREGDVPVRLGGEEFCVLMPGTDRDAAIRAAERLRLQTSEQLRDLIPEGVTISVGVAVDPDGRLDAARLLSAADKGLYVAKQGGRDRSVAVGLSDEAAAA